ncbi:hypothetical protein [Photorhabdus laumondii]
MSSKNDKNDTVATVATDNRPGIRYVPEKTLEQQDIDIQYLHRVPLM